jgi:hypothetical protein
MATEAIMKPPVDHCDCPVHPDLDNTPILKTLSDTCKTVHLRGKQVWVCPNNFSQSEPGCGLFVVNEPKEVDKYHRRRIMKRVREHEQFFAGDGKDPDSIPSPAKKLRTDVDEIAQEILRIDMRLEKIEKRLKIKKDDS